MRGAENLFQVQLLKVHPSSSFSPSSPLFFFFLFWSSEMTGLREKCRLRRAASGEKKEPSVTDLVFPLSSRAALRQLAPRMLLSKPPTCLAC